MIFLSDTHSFVWSDSSMGVKLAASAFGKIIVAIVHFRRLGCYVEHIL